MTSVFVGKHLANDGLGDALNVFFGEMCTPRCDTVPMTDSQMLLFALFMLFSLIFVISLIKICRGKDGNLPAFIVCAISGTVAVGCAIYVMAPLFDLI
ncbi:MAG: hypothetical protein Q4F64_04255 [Corynebacterium casei]|nr:hypothetical protein [Corynebacterium casei]